MLKECMWIPRLETERLFLRKLTPTDVDIDPRPNCIEALKRVIDFIFWRQRWTD